MFWGNSAKIDILKEMIGTPEEYKKTIEMSHLTSEEKDIIMTASVQLRKNHHNNDIMDKAYDILFGNATQSNSGANSSSNSVDKKSDDKTQVESKQSEQKEYNAAPENLEDEDIYGFKDD
ncbi:hypothetical protein MNB_SV-6-1038 [hydrothermal vent metagenome]|uniref:Uncharacterized protein n=1 Tax=hydrothermal vent metagenome TaxID=652676 RepID=A0A1W1C7P9_9ZZZZ